MRGPCFESVATVMNGGAVLFRRALYPLQTMVTPAKPARAGIIDRSIE
jgi:hypothetical protein